MEQFLLLPGRLLITGDFNIHFENNSDSDAMKFADILDSLGLIQHVTCPTHISGHTLDLIITRNEDNIIVSPPVCDTFLSDHSTLLCDVAFEKAPPVRNTIQLRRLKHIDLEIFRKDLSIQLNKMRDTTDLEPLVDTLNTSLRSTLDLHAPVVTIQVTERPHQPWFSDEISSAKREKRRCERRWHCSRLEVDLQMFRKARNHLIYIVQEAKQAHYSTLIQSNQSDQKTLFKIINGLLHRNTPSLFPRMSTDQLLASSFNDFFFEKIRNIRSRLDNTIAQAVTDHIASTPCTPTCHMDNFSTVSSSSILHLIKKSPTKSCLLDAAPINILKSCSNVLITYITRFVNLSLSTGIFPQSFKEAVITPLLKKDGLDPVFKNYRPISNLPFLSKLLERIVSSQLLDYMHTNYLFEPCQSAYQKYHSTETALLKIHNDVFRSLDDGDAVLLVLLDLSAAFDTVDHQLLLNRLQYNLGLSGTVLKWFHSCLSGRQQRVRIKNSLSSTKELQWGVPQGSVLGLLLFLIYLLPLGHIIRNHNLTFHMYADDVQLYLSFEPNTESSSSAVEAIQHCVEDIRSWMTNHKLKLNDEKTEFILLGRKRQLTDISVKDLYVGDSSVERSLFVRNLGFLFDENFTMQKQISAVCKTAYFHLRNIARIRKYLSESAAQSLVHAFVSSRIDYCNSLFSGLPKNLLTKLQHVQNSAARIVKHVRKREHITPILIDLHWLPVAQRIKFKILLLTFKAMHGMSPEYICDLIHTYQPARSLRSADASLLVVPRTLLETCGKRAFIIYHFHYLSFERNSSL